MKKILKLAAAAALVYAPAARYAFIDFDDPGYVTANPHVLGGLTADNMRRAWTTFAEANWHPLTWLSLQLDATLWGPGPLGFHLTSVALHSLIAGLLYAVLAAATGSAGRSAAAALLFAAIVSLLSSSVPGKRSVGAGTRGGAAAFPVRSPPEPLPAAAVSA